MNYFDECKKENGSVVYDDVEYALLEQPEITNYENTVSGVCFQAHGFSVEQLKRACGYSICEGFDDCALIRFNCDKWWKGDRDDASEACDWDSPMSVTMA